MEAGRAPEPTGHPRKRGGSHSGRLLLRMPESLHAELAKASQRAGVSLNGYINDALAAAVGRAPGAAPAPRRRLLERLLVANLVVVVAVGVLVAVLLVQAVR